jgi:hypothetical protein
VVVWERVTEYVVGFGVLDKTLPQQTN